MPGNTVLTPPNPAPPASVSTSTNGRVSGQATVHTRPWWVKTLRVFVFTFLGTFILAITPLADQIASGETLSLGPSLLLGLVVR